MIRNSPVDSLFPVQQRSIAAKINNGTSNPYKNNNHAVIAPTFPGTLNYFHKYITKREKQIKFWEIDLKGKISEIQNTIIEAPFGRRLLKVFVNVFQVLGVPIANALIAVSFFFNVCPLLRSECKLSLFETNYDWNSIAALSNQASL